jgi:GAF domain-containing protein
VQQRELDRLENLRRKMITLDQHTISEMVTEGADVTTKRTESVRWILYAVQQVLSESIPDPDVRDSFIECVRDGRPRAIPFPPSPDPAVRLAHIYTLRVLKHHGLTEVEINDIAGLPEGVGLVNRSVSSGEVAYVPDVDSPEAAGLGYWRPPHRVTYRSMICVPAFARQRVIGVLCADSTKVGAFGDWEKDVLEHFALKIALRYASLPSEGLWD